MALNGFTSRDSESQFVKSMFFPVSQITCASAMPHDCRSAQRANTNNNLVFIFLFEIICFRVFMSIDAGV